MKRHRTLSVSSARLTEDAISSYVERFAQSTRGWHFPSEKSAEYARMCGAASCCIVHTNGDLPEAAVHLTSRGSGGLHMANIVPLKTGQLTLEAYNALAMQFAKDLRARARADEVAISVSLSHDEIGLHDLITGKIVWKLFEQYIDAYPLSHHPADVRRLDRFICALSRYSRKPFDADAFQHLLTEELDWPTTEAEHCRRRVEIGLEVLAEYRNF